MIPDVAYLRRHHPEIRHVRLEGAGLEPFELEALEGVRVSIGDRPSAPSITFLHVPRQVALGAPVEVQGRLNRPNAGERIEISLESPDGTNTTTSVAGDGNAGAPFKLTAASPAAEGRFVWRLKMSRGGGENAQLVAQERIGISVVKPALPRVLALDGAPRIETAHLQRWFAKWAAASGRARLSALIDIALPPRAKERGFRDRRCRVARDVDVVLLDRRALVSLLPNERAALRAAVTERGTGLLVVPYGEGATVIDAEEVEESDFFLPWNVISPPEVEDDDGPFRTTRLSWPGLSAPLEEAVPIDGINVELQRGETELVRDTQGRSIVVSARRGRGEVAMSLARDTWRWQLAGKGEAFAGYWSHLLSHLARRDSSDSWRIANEETAPLFVTGRSSFAIRRRRQLSFRRRSHRSTRGIARRCRWHRIAMIQQRGAAPSGRDRRVGIVSPRRVARISTSLFTNRKSGRASLRHANVRRQSFT
jgi:hypothetical protein